MICRLLEQALNEIQPGLATGKSQLGLVVVLFRERAHQLIAHIGRITNDKVIFFITDSGKKVAFDNPNPFFYAIAFNIASRDVERVLT